MDSVLWELLKQVPALAVLAWVVYVFLKFIRQCEADRSENVKRLADDCHRIQQRAIDGLDRNTEILGAVKLLLERLNGVKL